MGPNRTILRGGYCTDVQVGFPDWAFCDIYNFARPGHPTLHIGWVRTLLSSYRVCDRCMRMHLAADIQHAFLSGIVGLRVNNERDVRLRAGWLGWCWSPYLFFVESA